jgi:3',5'-cyclic AMP phosphodiesterase CpdA
MLLFMHCHAKVSTCTQGEAIMAGTKPGRKLLATFVHISDIHIGEIDPASGDARTSRLAAQVYSNTPWLDGLLGHHGRALHELDEFVVALRAKEPELRLIASGDLSRFGAPSELADARRYIEDEIDIAPPNANNVGLRLGRQSLVIPGNHDQWGGTAGPGGAVGSRYGVVFGGAVPFIQSVALDKTKHIVFLGVDSDANVSRLSIKRVLAIGAFQSQLQKLQASLKTKRDDEFRILLIHHSWFQSGKILRMADASKGALEQFMVDNQVSAMLCGHSHHPLLNSFTATAPHGNSKVYELRCGSTTQHDTVPLKWKTLLQNRPARNWDPNTLIVHRVYQDSAAMTWRAELHVRGAGGFKHVPQWDKEFPLQ